jgi:hypothetical protein
VHPRDAIPDEERRRSREIGIRHRVGCGPCALGPALSLCVHSVFGMLYCFFTLLQLGRADNLRVHGKRTKCSKASAVVLLIARIAISIAKAQNQAPSLSSSATPVFRANARLVQVDLVVTDKSGNPIIGLHKSDFTVLQDGKTQTVTAFEAHVPVPAGRRALQATAPKPPLPPNTYTNQPPIITGQSWNIVVYDIVNTPVPDQ